MEPVDWFSGVFFACLAVGMICGTVLATLAMIGIIREIVDEARKETEKRKAERERIKGKRSAGQRD